MIRSDLILQSLTAFKAFLLDLDGTLATSEPLKGRALADTCRHYGGTADMGAYLDVMGEDWPTVTGHFFRIAGIAPDFDEFNAHFRDRYLALLEQEVTPTAGAAAFIAQAKRHGIRLGLVSSAAPWMVDKVLTRLGLRDAFDIVITQADVTRHKPDPEAYLLALQRLGLHAEEALVFEDSTAGLKAAHAAGCTSLVVRHAFNVRHDLSLARQAIDNFEGLLADAIRPAGSAPFLRPA